jgi:hypothetical protein
LAPKRLYNEGKGVDESSDKPERETVEFQNHQSKNDLINIVTG